MDVDEVAFSISPALESLISEAGLNNISEATKAPLPSKKQKTSKRLLEAKHRKKEADCPSTGKIHSTDSNPNPLSQSSSVTGSTISISENILKNRYSNLNQDPYDVYIQRISNPKAPLHFITVGRII
ncbi:glycine cleavage system protein h-like protein [Lasius niger]|uniref:Glycine cleavage system protein h-like protein n=1 Tax=Lasius niger TaxID=67767 RepID=A0A0J7KLA3_LASNI|nr:glycine cleavage system protein h-like protein [Lasius niger]